MATKDPVCGMRIDEPDALLTSEYQGTTYYFCSRNCKEEFDHHPVSYVD